MRKGMDGLAMLAQKVLEQDPLSGHLFVFRGRAANPSSLGRDMIRPTLSAARRRGASLPSAKCVRLTL